MGNLTEGGDYGLTLRDTADVLCVSVRTVKRLIADEKIKSVKASARRRIIRRSDLDIYLENLSSR